MTYKAWIKPPSLQTKDVSWLVLVKLEARAKSGSDQWSSQSWSSENHQKFGLSSHRARCRVKFFDLLYLLLTMRGLTRGCSPLYTCYRILEQTKCRYQELYRE
jgi:hypothetical protein